MTKKIATFDRTTCKLVADKIAAALAPLAEELGVQIRTVGGTYMGGSFTCKVEVSTVGDNGVVMTKDAGMLIRFSPTREVS